MKSSTPNHLVIRFALLAGFWLGQICVITAAPADVPFWKKPVAQSAPAKYAPASVTLLGVPDLSPGLMTFGAGNSQSQANFVPTNPMVVPYVKETEQAYRVIPGGLKEGANPYSDRKYKITNLPARLQDLTLLQTKAGHKGIVDGRFSIQVMVSQPAILFLAIDDRDLKTWATNGCPSWLQDFEPTGDALLTDDPMLISQGASYLVFRKKVAAGPLGLGPCAVDPRTDSMYFAFFALLDPAAG